MQIWSCPFRWQASHQERCCDNRASPWHKSGNLRSQATGIVTPAGSPFSQLDPMSCRPSGNIMVLSCLNLHLNYGIHLANISTTWPHHKQNRDQQLIRRPETETACSLCSFVIVAPSHTPWLIRFLSPLIQVALHLLAIWESWASSVTWKMCGSQRQLLATVLPLYQHIKTISEARNEKTPRWTEYTSLLISAKKNLPSLFSLPRFRPATPHFFRLLSGCIDRRASKCSTIKLPV